jgi:hypothetical protein
MRWKRPSGAEGSQILLSAPALTRPVGSKKNGEDTSCPHRCSGYCIIQTPYIALLICLRNPLGTARSRAAFTGHCVPAIAARDSVWRFYLPEFLRALKRVRATLIRAPAEATSASTRVGSSGESSHPICARTKAGMHITAITTNSARNLFFIT